VTGDSPRAELLRLAWQGIRMWSPDNIENLPAAQRAASMGAAPADVAAALNAAAYEAVFNLLFILDDGGAPNGDDMAPAAWAVVALPGGEQLHGLHEEVLMADPTGREGSDLFG
jgi:hypothetical protein